MRCADKAMYRSQAGGFGLRDLRPDARHRARPAAAGRGPAWRHRPRRARAALPAPDRSSQRQHHGRRGAPALAAPPARLHPAARVSAAGRGGQPDAAAHGASCSTRRCPVRPLARRGPRPVRVDQRLGDQHPRRRIHRPHPRAPEPPPAARRRARRRDHRDDRHLRLRAVQAGHGRARRARVRRLDRRLRRRLHLAALPQPPGGRRAQARPHVPVGARRRATETATSRSCARPSSSRTTSG